MTSTDTGPSSMNSMDNLSVLAAQTLKIASINGLGDTTKLETELEDEIRWEESRRPPSETIERLRRRCEEILHSKGALLVIVTLNIVDCLLVMAELTLDFLQVSDRFLDQTENTEDFTEKLQEMYPNHLDDLGDVEEADNLIKLFNSLLKSFIIWDPQYTGHALASACQPIIANFSPAINTSIEKSSVLTSLLAFNSSQIHLDPTKVDTYDAIEVAHGLHYASISILSVLVVETLLKIACVGKRFLKKKMEIFDAMVIMISFTLDIVFVEGLSNLHMQNFIVIMSFLLPWRVLRVLNSLIVAVMDQHRFHLKLLYKQKRKITKQYNEAAEHVTLLEKQVERLKSLCNAKGIGDWELNKALGQTLSPHSQGGLKALGKLVFQAAESFAPLSSSQLNGCSSDMTTTTRSLGTTPSFTLQCNGDIEHTSSGAPALETSLVDETDSSDSSPRRGANGSDAVPSSREDSGLSGGVDIARTSDSEVSYANVTFGLPSGESVDLDDVDIGVISETTSATKL